MGSQHTLTRPYIFSGVRTPNPHDLRLSIFGVTLFTMGINY